MQSVIQSTRSEPYLWVHLAGIAAVPIFLELCLLGLKAAETSLPAGLVFLLVAVIGIGPVFWMQWQRPFNIFSLVFLALKPSQLTETQRRILGRFKTPLGKIIAVCVAIAALAILWQLNQWVPLVVIKAKLVPAGSFGGLILAATSFLLTNLFLQVPASVLPVLLTSDRLLVATDPYPVKDIARDFTMIGFQVKQILPPLTSRLKPEKVNAVAESVAESVPELAEETGTPAVPPEPVSPDVPSQEPPSGDAAQPASLQSVPLQPAPLQSIEAEATLQESQSKPHQPTSAQLEADAPSLAANPVEEPQLVAPELEDSQSQDSQPVPSETLPADVVSEDSSQAGTESNQREADPTEIDHQVDPPIDPEIDPEVASEIDPEIDQAIDQAIAQSDEQLIADQPAEPPPQSQAKLQPSPQSTDDPAPEPPVNSACNPPSSVTDTVVTIITIQQSISTPAVDPPAPESPPDASPLQEKNVTDTVIRIEPPID